MARGLKTARIGAIGARPAAFKTVRYSEKILEASGIAVEPIDLSEVLGRVNRLANDDADVLYKLGEMQEYVATEGIPGDALVKMAKLGLVIDRWMRETDVNVSAVQCWTSLEEFFGVVPCTIMSMMSDVNMPSACEVDVCGTISMYALTLASQTPSALLDWNNNYGEDPNKAVCFHCSNLPKSFFEDVKMDYQAIIAGTVGRDNTYGTVVGKVRSSPMSFARFSTDDRTGKDSRLRRRRTFHRRSADDVRRRRRRRNSAVAGAVALHLHERLRAPRRRDDGDRRRRGSRSDDAVSGLGRAATRLRARHTWRSSRE